MRRIIIADVKKPREDDVDRDIEWMCQCLGMLTPRDHDGTSTKVLKVMLFAARDDRGLSSDEVAERVGISRGTAIHHIKRYMNSGIIVKQRSSYELRMGTLRETLDEIELDMERTIRRIKKIAEEIDDEMGL